MVFPSLGMLDGKGTYEMKTQLYCIVECLVIIGAFVFCGLRLDGYKDLFFKDFAHVWVGMLLGGWILKADKKGLWCCLFWVMLFTECLCAFVIYPIR